MTSAPIAAAPNEGARLFREAIEAKGETQGAAARALATTSSMVNRWLLGTRKPSRYWAPIIEERYGVPMRAWDQKCTVPGTRTIKKAS